MVFGDLPANYEYSKTSSEQVMADVSHASREMLTTDSFNLLAQNPAKKTGEKMSSAVSNIGAVDHMDLPPGWTKGSDHTGIAGQGTSSSYQLAGSKDAELTFFDRGRRYSSNAAAFSEILSKPAHVLGPKELHALGPILGNYDDPRAFKMSACKTEDINGKRVVVIEGTWNAIGHESYSILANPDGKGETVQEIYFKAAPAEYKANLAAATQAIKSIRWK